MDKERSQQTPRRGGRPSREEADKLEDKILDAAAALFFEQGYGATSIEKIAQHARISKRTFYARYEDKAAVFRAVVHRVIRHLRPPETATDQLFIGQSLEEILHRIAPVILQASLSSEGLALMRVVLAEATRFPELALIMHEQGARREAIDRIAKLLRQQEKIGEHKISHPDFAAEQFLFMLTSAPQRRGLGLGPPMEKEELDAWAKNTVELFLNGCRAEKI